MPSRLGLGQSAQDQAHAHTTFFDCVKNEIGWLSREYVAETDGIVPDDLLTKLDQLSPLGLMALVDLVERWDARYSDPSQHNGEEQGISHLLDSTPAPIRVQEK